MAGSSPTRCTHLVPQPDAKVAAGRPQSRIRVKLRAIGSIGRGSLHDTTSKTYACNQLKRRAIFRCVNLVGSSPAMTGLESLAMMVLESPAMAGLESQSYRRLVSIRSGYGML